jgi:hypothetical protein
MNEHLLRYLNLRVPHDYDTSPLWLFYGLCLIWLMPFSVFLFKAAGTPLYLSLKSLATRRRTPTRHSSTLITSQPPINSVILERSEGPLYSTPPTISSDRLAAPAVLSYASQLASRFTRPQLFLLLWAALPLLFFSLSTRQEYYVLPSLPPLALLIAGWLAQPATKPGAPACPERSRMGLASETWDPTTSRAALRITAVLLALGTIFAATTAVFLLHTQTPASNADLATLLTENPSNYALSMGHFLDLTGQALALFRLPLSLAALSFFLGPLAAFLLRSRHKPHAANLSLAGGAFGFLLAAHLGLQTFAPVLTSAQLAQAIAPQVHPQDLIAIHGEYESGSTLGFYLQRSDIHILEGRSSNLWYGSFFPDAPKIFETPATLAAKWQSPQRIFLWQSLTDPPNQLPPLPSPVYILVKSGGKEILSNQPNH